MLSPTTKELMFKSLPFKLAFGGAIGSLIAIFILSIVVVSVTCVKYNSCYDNYYPYSYQCTTNYGSVYCCQWNYQTCGDSFCTYKYYSSSFSCMGFFIAMQVFGFVCFVLTIAVFIMFCNFRKRAAAGDYYARMDLYNPNPIIANRQPVVII